MPISVSKKAKDKSKNIKNTKDIKNSNKINLNELSKKISKTKNTRIQVIIL